MTAVVFSFVYWGIKKLTTSVVDLVIMSVVFFFVPSIRFCDPDEYVIFNFDLCTDLFGGDWQRGGLIEPFERDPATGKIVY